MILLDSNHFSILLDERDRLHLPLHNRLNQVIDDVAIPIVVVEETMRGWLALIRKTKRVREQVEPYRRLARLIDYLGKWNIVGWNNEAAAWFERLRKAKVRIGSRDLKIASIALDNDTLLLSANISDFQQVPDLHLENWLHPL